MSNVETPTGITMPKPVYSALVAAAITLGSALFMVKMEFPAWTWIFVFLVLWAATATMARFNTKPSLESPDEIRKENLLAFALIALVVILGIAVPLIYLDVI